MTTLTKWLHSFMVPGMQLILFSSKYLYQTQSNITQSKIGKLISTVYLNIGRLGRKFFSLNCIGYFCASRKYLFLI